MKDQVLHCLWTEKPIICLGLIHSIVNYFGCLWTDYLCDIGLISCIWFYVVAVTITMVFQLVEAMKQSFTGSLLYALILVFIIWTNSYMKLSVSLELTCIKYLIVKTTPMLFTYFKKYSLSTIYLDWELTWTNCHIHRIQDKLTIVP